MSYDPNNPGGGGGNNSGGGGINGYVTSASTSGGGALTEGSIINMIRAQDQAPEYNAINWQQYQQQMDELMQRNNLLNEHWMHGRNIEMPEVEFQPIDPHYITSGIDIAQTTGTSHAEMFGRPDNEIKNKKSKLTKKIIDKIQEKKAKEIEDRSKKEIIEKKSAIEIKKSQKSNLAIEISEIKNEIVGLKKKKVVDLDAQFKNILDNKDIKDIYLLDDDIVFETKELFVQDFYMNCGKKNPKKTKKPHDLGRFAIRINTDFNKMSVTNLTYDGGGYDLPTIQNNACCWGNISQDIKNDLSELNIEEFIVDMLAYLQSPGNSAAYKRWESWFKERKKAANEIAPIKQDVGNNTRNYNSAIGAYTSTLVTANLLDSNMTSITFDEGIVPQMYVERHNDLVQSLLDNVREWAHIFHPLNRRSHNDGLQSFLDCFIDRVAREYVAGWMIMVGGSAVRDVQRLIIQNHNRNFTRIIFAGTQLDLQIPNPRGIDLTRLESIISEINDYLAGNQQRYIPANRSLGGF